MKYSVTTVRMLKPYLQKCGCILANLFHKSADARKPDPQKCGCGVGGSCENVDDLVLGYKYRLTVGLVVSVRHSVSPYVNFTSTAGFIFR